jgi:hypothetical protein
MYSHLLSYMLELINFKRTIRIDCRIGRHFRVTRNEV